MGDLPRERVTPSFPFCYVGIDFCGPFHIKFKNQRKGILNKVYVCIFVCLSTKAIHLDFVSDLTSDAFIACLKRFFSRRGKSSKIFSDNAKNFVGASTELKKLYKMVSHPNETLANFLLSENIEWKFIPPRSPNFGGLWETGVKSFKHHLKRVVGNAHLTLEEFLTIILEIESVLNSRPLTPLSTEFDNFETLSPGHFLIGRPLTSTAEPDLLNITENILFKWKKITKYSQQIWRLWKKDYLNTLQQRSKWMFSKNNVKLGALVLIKDENMPSVKWLTGRISEIIISKDEKVRVVNVLLPTGFKVGSVKKLETFYPIGGAHDLCVAPPGVIIASTVSVHDTNDLTAINVGIDSNSVVQTAPESKGVLSSVRTQELHSFDPDTEMRASSSSEDDILEYEMSEELEETSSDSVSTPPLVQNGLQIPQLQATAVRNTSASPAIVNPTGDNDTVTIKKSDWLAVITIKKSDWLALLAIKKSWEEKSPSSRISHTPRNPTSTKIPQPTLACPIVQSTDSDKNNPVPPTKNSLNIQIASNTSTSIPNTSTLSENSSISEKPKIKRPCNNKK
ncbi:hypothetical protein AVEN_39034-1 [Araneus ventricosus]|uniref:Integrase catalytic domain-containing protein n=1 Tax=Araneus ventricosus TaxID=182803 RepID=A0A4Y2MD77_ARAVE|nr:hypothetical protein AVEN_39034-1 [Araneus ventricosus]